MFAMGLKAEWGGGRAGGGGAFFGAGEVGGSIIYNFVWTSYMNGRFAVCSFICQVASARRQRSELFGLRVKLPPVTTRLTTQR